MSSLRVTAEPLVIHPHPNADALELAQVGLYRAVVAKGQYRTGDYALYIPEQALLPAALVDELGLSGKLAGKGGNRVKAVRLRGELSQGIVCVPAAVADDDLAAAHHADVDFSDRLTITKWTPEVPVHMSGQAVAAPHLLRWVDIENLKRYPTVFTAGEPVVATEKLHGTACCVTYTAVDDQVTVTSKGLGESHLALVEDDTNLYWRAVRGHGVDALAAQVAARYDATRVGVYGEVYGAGIQDLGYGHNARTGGPGYALFDIRVDVAGTMRWLDQDEIVAVLAELDTTVAMVPRLYAGPFDLDELLRVASGKETVSGTEANIREGIVIRPAAERHSEVLGGRAILKLVSEAYLTRKGGTEYQ